MKINDNLNYCILSNNVTKEFLNKFSGYQILDSNYTFNKLKEKLEMFPSKQVVFNETLYNLRAKEREEILDLLKMQNIKFINITSDIEQSLYADYIVVFDNLDIMIEGPKEGVLKEEKILKRLGYGLPFVVDLSAGLQVYDIFDKTYYDIPSLVGDLWN